jgi:hypothetical protein
MPTIPSDSRRTRAPPRLAILAEVVSLKGLSIADFGFRISDSSGDTKSIRNPQSRNPQFQQVARRFAGAKNAVALGGPAVL